MENKTSAINIQIDSNVKKDVKKNTPQEIQEEGKCKMIPGMIFLEIKKRIN